MGDEGARGATWLSAVALLKLQRAGFTDPQVEALAEYLDTQAATRADLLEFKGDLRAEIAELRVELKGDIAELRAELKGEIRTCGRSCGARSPNCGRKWPSCGRSCEPICLELRAEVGADMKALEQRMTIKLGSMLVVAIAIVSALVKLL